MKIPSQNSFVFSEAFIGGRVIVRECVPEESRIGSDSGESVMMMMMMIMMRPFLMPTLQK